MCVIGQRHINEEASILGFPALNLREVHERPEAMEEAAVMMVGLEIERIKQALDLLANQTSNGTSNSKIVSDYNVPKVSDKIVKIIHSYTDYVNRVVWKNTSCDAYKSQTKNNHRIRAILSR